MYLIHGGENHGRRCSLTPMIFQNSAFSKKSEPKTRKCEDGAELNIKEKRTWPPTTATEGSDSQREWEAWSAPWSPRRVHARWIRLTREINEFIVAIGSDSVSGSGSDSGSDEDEEVVKVRMKKRTKGKKRMRIREAILCVGVFQLRYCAFRFSCLIFKICFVCVCMRERRKWGT